MFKAAIKAVTQRDDDAPHPTTRRRGGEKQGGGPIMMRLIARHAGRPAARGRYRRLQPSREHRTGRGGQSPAPPPQFALAAASVCDIAAAVAEAFKEIRKVLEKVLLNDAGLNFADTLDWLKLWQDNADHWPDDDFSAKQDRYFPQP